MGIIFGSEVVKPVYRFLKTNFMIVTNLNDYVTGDDDNDDDFGYLIRNNMIAQFEQDLYNQKFSDQDQGKGDEIDTLQKRTMFWPIFIAWGDQYLIMFMIMIKTTMERITLFAGRDIS